MRWDKVTLIGVGLLGASLGQALKRRGLAREVTGFVRRQASIRECRRFKATDWTTLNLEEAVEGAELIVLCTPIGQMLELTRSLRPWLRPGTIVTDVGSVKGSVVRELEITVAKAGGYFIGSHPMAGSEKTGVAAARPDLFEGAICVVTPTGHSHRGALLKVERLWRDVGMRLLRLSPKVHDELVSRSSHLPHLVAAGLVNRVLDPKYPREQAWLCANGFRDTTRIASGSPEMWRDIVLANREPIERALASFTADLTRLRKALKSGNGAALARFFGTAKRRRDHWSGGPKTPSPE